MSTTSLYLGTMSAPARVDAPIVHAPGQVYTAELLAAVRLWADSTQLAVYRGRYTKPGSGSGKHYPYTIDEARYLCYRRWLIDVLSTRALRAIEGQLQSGRVDVIETEHVTARIPAWLNDAIDALFAHQVTS